MSSGNPIIGKAKAVTATESTLNQPHSGAPVAAQRQTTSSGRRQTLRSDDSRAPVIDNFALGPNWRARASHLTKAASSLDADHTSFSKLNHQIEIDNAYAKMRRQGRRIPSGITGLRSLVKPGRVPIDPTAIPAVPTLRELLQLSYTDWIDRTERPNLLKNIGELFETRRSDLQDLAKQYRAQMKDANADSVATVEKIHLIERRLIELDHEVEALEAHQTQLA